MFSGLLVPDPPSIWITFLSYIIDIFAGLLVPDLPMEETGVIRAAASAAGLQLTLLATPTTPEPRMRAIASISEGFVYLVSVAGAQLDRRPDWRLD